jgi:aconitase A
MSYKPKYPHLLDIDISKLDPTIDLPTKPIESTDYAEAIDLLQTMINDFKQINERKQNNEDL